MKTVAVIGLGYVGLPVAIQCAGKGYATIGVDINQEKVDSVNKGISPLEDAELERLLPEVAGKFSATTGTAEAVAEADVVIICVPTPVDHDHKPNLSALTEACTAVAKTVNDGTLVIIESTIFPGTIEEVARPIFDKAGKKPSLAHCPERIDPGNKRFTIANIPRVIGGVTPEATEAAASFYRTVIDADVMELGSVKAAEATKIMENTFRDINIAFVNEMAKSFDKAGIDIMEVIKGASTKPFGFMPHYPGAGVGGHCISVDPYYLISKAKQFGFNHEFLSLARKINESMPSYAVELLEESLIGQGARLEGQRVGVLGVAYKPDVDDTRESPALEIIMLLKKKGAVVDVFDPHVKGESTTGSLEEFLKRVDHVILATNHGAFSVLDGEGLKKHGIKTFIDGRNSFDKEDIKRAGIGYHGIGRS